MYIATSGQVGIGTTDPTQQLEVNGTIKATNLLLTSDRRAKHNIISLDSEDSLRKICSVRPVSFQWNRDGRLDEGVIAQELMQIFPDLVVTNSDGSLSVEYPALIAPLISSVQELNRQNTQLRSDNNELKSRLDRLEDQNKSLQNTLNLILEKLDKR
jgi:hypothetical protein